MDYETAKTEKISEEWLIETPHFAFNLNELCHSDYFCKHSQITLTELARELRTNRTSLSNYLNMSLKISFHDFVNMQRVKYAEELLKCNSEARLTQEEIAEQSGFNSLSTFRRAFVKKHNMSPLQYQQQYKVSWQRNAIIFFVPLLHTFISCMLFKCFSYHSACTSLF